MSTIAANSRRTGGRRHAGGRDQRSGRTGIVAAHARRLHRHQLVRRVQGQAQADFRSADLRPVAGHAVAPGGHLPLRAPRPEQARAARRHQRDRRHLPQSVPDERHRRAVGEARPRRALAIMDPEQETAVRNIFVDGPVAGPATIRPSRLAASCSGSATSRWARLPLNWRRRPAARRPTSGPTSRPDSDRAFAWCRRTPGRWASCRSAGSPT